MSGEPPTRPSAHRSIEKSALAERFFSGMIEEPENRAWAERNAQSLEAHGRDIATTGLAGEEFERT